MVQLTVHQALQLLELQPGASLSEIRAAYKRLALRYHPDKQIQHNLITSGLNASPAAVQQQGQGTNTDRSSSRSSSTPQDPAVRFALLSAAYQQLTSTAADAQARKRSDRSESTTFGQDLQSFEAAYASGSLFTEELLDEALLAGLSPSEITIIQVLVEAAAAGELAAALAQQQPTPEDEQTWRKLYDRLLLKWQLEHLQQQQQQQQQQQGKGAAGNGLLGEMLSDLLLKPIGQVMVEVSDDGVDDDQEDFEQKQQQQQQRWQQLPQSDNIAAAAMTKQSQVVGSTYQQQQQQQQEHPLTTMAAHQQDQFMHSSSGSSSNPKRRMRHGLGFYWTWLRRLLVAKAVVSILLSGRTRSADYHSALFAAL